MFELVDHFRDAEGNEVTLFPSNEIDDRLFVTARDVRLNKSEAQRFADALLRFVESHETAKPETVEEESYGTAFDVDLDPISVSRARSLIRIEAPINDENDNPTGALLVTSLDWDAAEELASYLNTAAADAKKVEDSEPISDAFFD